MRQGLITTTSAGLAMCLLAAAVWALDDSELTQVMNTVPGMSVERVGASPLPGYRSVQLSDGSILQVAEDGGSFVVGDVYAIGAAGVLENLSEPLRDAYRRELLQELDDDDLALYRPAGEVKATITAFIDVDCGYCQSMHQALPQLLAAGILVRYAAFPRGGANPDAGSTYYRMVGAWCSAARSELLAAALTGTVTTADPCEFHPVKQQHALGVRMGVRGTPTIVLPDGRMIVGFRSSEFLLAELGLPVPAVATDALGSPQASVTGLDLTGAPVVGVGIRQKRAQQQAVADIFKAQGTQPDVWDISFAAGRRSQGIPG